MTNTNKDTTTEYILRMYDKLTQENKKKFREYLDFLLFCQREKEARG